MIKNPKELLAKYEELSPLIEARRGHIERIKDEVLVCAGTGCLSSKSAEIIKNLQAEFKSLKLDVEVKATGCFGFCEKGPIVKVMPDDTFYSKFSLDDVKPMVKEHFVDGHVYEKKLYIDPASKKVVKKASNIPFYKKQERIALRHCGMIDAECIDEYIGDKGYLALAKTLTEFKPEEVIEEIKKSGLRGRGGGGFPTGTKWSFCAREKADQKYVICNADEGDPGAFMDRSILEGAPHSVIEAMIINGYAIGATQGFIYVRAEYPIAVHRFDKAIQQARKYGLLGKNILGSGFDFDLEIRLGSGAFVCGEETALIASIEGERGMPRNKPPFPAVRGLWGKPTNVNNVETYANIPYIMLNGAESYAKLGTATSKGTKVFAVGGKVVSSGLVEVEMGTTLREVIYDVCEGIPNKKKFKAVQTGGPSGGCLTEKHLDTKIGFDELVALGSMMGSGGMIIMDEDNCMVDVAKFYLEFTVDESCGKCTPCREGTKRLHEILEKITEGKGTMADLDILEELCYMIKDSSLCGLGQTAPNPILSTLEHFRHEYEAHINEKRCPAGVCKKLTKLVITDKCIGCTKCAKNCPVNCITGKVKELHVINQNTCIVCGACIRSCPVHAIETA